MSAAVARSQLVHVAPGARPPDISNVDEETPTQPRKLSPEAQRALAEAEARRAAAEPLPHAAEKGGPKGPEPTRYGDWERKGIAVDF
jgi:hypothetical protein